MADEPAVYDHYRLTEGEPPAPSSGSSASAAATTTA